ncbi:hypothetical protein WJX73_006737 [Symbiochloris irregularis]|uniref:SHSP domain-containing protein n=1 Tax=Symbiochloris irregularis TaxID=706552 RepID=A0AAW1NQ94_9CHLO
MALQLFSDELFAPFWADHYQHPRQQRGSNQRAFAEAARPTLIDISENSKAFKVSADLPGVNKDDIKLHVEGDVLSLAVEKTVEKQEDYADQEVAPGFKLHRNERAEIFMRRSLRLPESADLTKIRAQYQDGVLKLEILKHQGEVSRSRAISIE